MKRIAQATIKLVALALSLSSLAAEAERDEYGWNDRGRPIAKPDQSRNRSGIELGPRPQFLVDDMADSRLKRELSSCMNDEPRRTDFSIGQRGAPLQFPEHTKESYEAAFKMGAGILECDVTFTKDKHLVCRHAQNDLHSTTNILQTPLAATCITPFTPATFDASGNRVTPARAECRTSDITLAEFKTLRGKMDASNPNARTVDEYLDGTAPFRTDLYSGPTSGTLMTHAESIAFFKQLGAKFTPELKEAVVAMPFNGFTQEAYAQKMIDEYKTAGVNPGHVWPQSFDINDVLYWINREPRFGKQAVYLDNANVVAELPTFQELASYKARGINVWAPPTYALLTLDANDKIVPSQHARWAKMLGLELITWTLERSGILADGNNGFYYLTIDPAISREGDVMRVLDVLAQEVGVRGVFSDWAAPVSFYASCMGLN